MNFSATSCYAALQAGFDQSVDSAFWNLVCYVIHKHEYSVIDMEKICHDFKDEFGFGIPYFPMKRILTLASKRGFIKQNRTEYYPIWEKLNGSDFEQQYNEYESAYSRLVQTYSLFVQEEFNIKQNHSEAKNELDEFIEKHGLEFFSTHEMISDNDEGKAVKIGYFIKALQVNHPDLYKFLDSLIVGRILKELITYDTDEGKTVTVNTEVYVDTSFAFRLLGIDPWERQEIYKSLVASMKAIGMKVKMFHHTYLEMDTIISSSIRWINNPNYDATIASDAATYFVRNHYKKNQIEDLLRILRKELRCHGVTVEDTPPYPNHLPIGVVHEQDVFDMIAQEYERTNEKFNLEEKRYTIEQDARSLFLTNFKSSGIPHKILTDMTHLFVTTNMSLVKISEQILKNSSGIVKFSLVTELT